MVGKFGDTAIAAAQSNAQTLSDQTELSQKVQSMLASSGNASIRDDSQRAAPTDKWEKFSDLTEDGLKEAPAGMLHALENPIKLTENAAISFVAGAAAKAILPETGVAGSIFALGLGAYFAEQTAVPLYKAYQEGMIANTMGGMHKASHQLGDAFGGLVVNAPIGILGYKFGSGLSGRVVVDGRTGTTEAPTETPTETRNKAPGKPVESAPGQRAEQSAGKVADQAKDKVSDRTAGPVPILPERYLPTKETYSGLTVPSISHEFLQNLQVDDTGTYYGAGARYPDIMADPEMASYITGHNARTMSAIDKTIYDKELATEAKAAAYKLPDQWQNSQATPPAHAIDVTDGGDGKMQIGSKTYTLTDDGAPNRKLVVSDAFHPGKVTTLIPEQKDFEMQQVIQVQAGGQGKFAVVGSKDGASVLHLYDGEGKAISEVSLPGYGTLHDVRQGTDPSQIQFLFDAPIAHPRVLTLDLASNQSSFSPLSSDVFDTDKFVTEKIMVPYTDVAGATQTAPVFISRSKALTNDGQNLSLFKIYGGFDVGPQYLEYSPSTASWLENGHVAVEPVLPGDGGLGSGNYKEGLGAGIDNTARALTAIIGKLHDMGISSPEYTGIYGRSNGGMVVNHMLNTRPDLIGAAVSESGVNSLFDSPVINVDTGKYWTDEFGDPNNPSDVPWMAKLDVLNNIPTAQKLPPTLVEIGTKDGIVNVGNGITYTTLRQQLGNGETLLFARIGEGHDPVGMNLSLQTAFLWDRLRPATS